MSKQKKHQLEQTPEFVRAVECMEGDNSVFLTGKAGTGKSTLLSYFTEHTKKKVAILAPTGVAALNIGGETIHSFFRFSTTMTVESVKKKARSMRKDEKFLALATLIIDEISMVRADLLDFIDLFLQIAREDERPFGGVQIIMIGDLYQLPPVLTSYEQEHFLKMYESPWFFDAHVIKQSAFQFEYIELEKIYRQSDGHFIDILNAIRTNTLEAHHLARLNERVMPRPTHQNTLCITSTNQRAATINEEHLSALQEKVHTFTATVEGKVEEKYFPTDQVLSLKKGAQVMFVCNDYYGKYVNGTIGTVQGFEYDGDDEEDCVLVRIASGEDIVVTSHRWDIAHYVYSAEQKSLGQTVVGTFRQIPLRLAWAMTIHKSQGKTFDAVHIDLDRGVFASGQSYVALSRARTLEGTTLEKPFKKTDIRLDWRVQKFLTTLHYERSEEDHPLKEKIKLIKQAIKKEKTLEIVYLKAKDIKSKRRIRPLFLEEMYYQDNPFLGLEAMCLLRNEKRVFNVERILSVEEVIQEQ